MAAALGDERWPSRWRARLTDVESLLQPENKDQLIAILTYHVVSGKIMSSDLLSTTSAPTVNGQSAPIGLRVGDANVIQADIDASNGVIHVIDTVLLPE